MQVSILHTKYNGQDRWIVEPSTPWKEGGSGDSLIEALLDWERRAQDVAKGTTVMVEQLRQELKAESIGEMRKD